MIDGRRYMFLWSDVIQIILQTFEVTQNDLARLLNIDKSVLSKIKNGTRNIPQNIDAEFVFKCVFDCENPESFTRNTPSDILSTLKEVIEGDYKEVRTSMDDCWDEKDYKSFVITFLNRARRNKKPAKVPVKKALEELYDEEQCSVEGDIPASAVSNNAVSGDLSPRNSSAVSSAHPQRKWSILSVLCPNKGECCYNCDYWKGNRTTYEAYRMPTYGLCIKYNRSRQLSSDPACESYKEHQKQFGEWGYNFLDRK